VVRNVQEKINLSQNEAERAYNILITEFWKWKMKQ
jgi:hypothetical protein